MPESKRAYGGLERLAEKSLLQLVAAVSLLCIVGYVLAGLIRIGYPYELEWMEGGCLNSALRMRNGLQLYVPPSLEFTPFVYTPLFYWTAGMLMRLTGEGYFAGRLISFLSTLATVLLLFDLARRETSSSWAGVLSAGFFLACFETSGLWYDVFRVDSMATFFVMAAWYVARRWGGLRGAVAAGLLMAIGALTKQSAIVIAAILGLAFLVYDLRRAIAFGAAAAVLFGGVSIWLQRASDGWYWFYTFTLPSAHSLERWALLEFWRQNVLFVFSIPLFLCIYLLSRRRRQEPADDGVERAGLNGLPPVVFGAAVLTGGMVAAWLGRMRSGGAWNALIPLILGLSVLIGPAVKSALADAGRLPAAGRARCLLLAAVLAQYFSLVMQPQNWAPGEIDCQRAKEYVRVLGTFRGEVFAPWHCYLPTLAGKRDHAHWMALYDVIRSKGEKTRTAREKIMRELSEAIESRRFEAIVADEVGEMGDILRRDFPGRYVLREDLKAFSPVARPKNRVVNVWVRSRNRRF